ncbi:hypothetical protein ACFWOJ_39685 [Streptomyces sp. NPDC058439]|uniref:hypothetical protein n=1 Tax=Streptomyces sp. NPDC058439 TaxID=3346500 RepID=UPI003653369C
MSRKFAMLLPFLALLVSAAGCSSHGYPQDIRQSDLLGVWAGPHGSRIDFLADHRVKATGFDFEGSPANGCSAADSGGKWAFYEAVDPSSGDYDMSMSATHGDSLSVIFGKLSESGSCYFSLDAMRKDENVRLCVTADPDSPCDGGVEFARKSDLAG